uniref:Late embryogenesis abundant protein LEA-2 subgroup domain-containing protein n=1 Tax=Rhizochromulina marina TaxID=1034831 RepID=A0A7S2WHU6_9STRA|mmetsp:Transcript_24794/g.72689  ORF Transcript_24794/g.72689 Transcript_24794/m.72689 type:complete len:213 (+) Transcript_24794:56-694(+)|eukprot:CAMPEP_0118962216 /NCGR_PEP_ID=MMETSP1173-20130426/634_1 /TAXON_ID=1034831 /ORGANISM="Rhizochromulina marina cf, Strain CCMP1243" /LENGTH=212 /DNA_ID=CAMNT_0006910455 /DNA_START=45 /DNA_END=683 /DNA_ORIENTATION=-
MTSTAKAAYVAMPADDAAPPPNYVTATSYLVIPQEPARRRRCGGSACCMCLTVFLVLFFLIPRYPSAVFKQLEVDGSGTVSGKFQFRNNNFYDVTFEDPSVKMYWLAYEVPASATCSFTVDVGRACGHTYNYQTCAVELGAFKNSDSFKVSGLHTQDKLLPMSDTQAAYVADMTVQAASTPQLLMSKGHLEAKSDVKDFNKVSLSDTIYCFY